MSQIDISVIIVTWNSEKWIKRCLDSILATSGDLKIEIIVVDNFSQDKTVDVINAYDSKIKLIQNTSNWGYAKGCNQGLKIAQGNYMLLLNPDTEVTESSLKKMLDFMEKNQNVGTLGPQLVDFEGQIQPSCRKFPNYKLLLWEFLGLSRFFPKSKIFGAWKMGDFDFRSTKEVEQPMGSALLIRKKVIDQIGFMDESFFLFYNDVDFCYRIKQAGWKIYFYPEARIFHAKGASTGQVRVKMIILSHWGHFLYLKKYHSSGLKGILLSVLGLALFFSSLVRIIFNFLKKFSPINKGVLFNFL